MNQSATPTLTKQKLEAVYPDGRLHLIGYVYASKYPILAALLNVPFGIAFKINAWRHNRRAAKYVAAQLRAKKEHSDA